MMKKRKGNLLEQHAEKIVLGVSVVIGLALLWFLVIGSPNSVQIGGRKFGAGEVDRQIRTSAEKLEARLNEPPAAATPQSGHKETYVAKLNSPLREVGDFKLIVPGRNPEAPVEDREYALPTVPPATNAFARAIRGTAHVPLEEVTPEIPYDKVPTTLKDMDLVSVQAGFDVAALYRNFKQSFIMGPSVRSDWRDDDLAAPVFAAAQLQRRRLLDDGRWSDWEVVPRPRIDAYRTRLDIPETTDNLKYDISMQKAQIKPFEIQQTILQPRPYDFASAETVWLTPSFYDEYVKILDREQKEALRQERERTLGTRRETNVGYETPAGRTGTRAAETPYADTRTRTLPSRGRTNEPTTRGRGTAAGAYYDEYMTETSPADRRRQQRTTADVIADNTKIIIDQRTSLETLQSLIFWAHDDTIEPGNTYEYRIRLGVFNPIAGRNWCAPQDRQYENQVILWSEFAQAPEPVVIPPMVYFFPTELARSNERGVTIEVARYHMGNWRKQGFDVRPGEMIGKPVDVQPQVSAADGRAAFDEYEMTRGTMLPEKIDFSTGAMLVDLVRSDAWTGLRVVRSELIDALYTHDGLIIQHVPVRKNSWTADMKAQYAQIEEAAAKTVTLNTSRGQSKVDVFKPRPAAYPAYGDGYRGYEDRIGVAPERRL